MRLSIVSVGLAIAAAEPSDEAKLAAVNKVISMLEDLQTQVLAEGEKEAAAYEKFGCFCKDTAVEKAESIKTGTDDQASISSTIGSLVDKRGKLDTKMEDLEKVIEQANEEMKKANEKRKETQVEYEKNEADLSGAIEALEGAISVLKSSKPSFMQLQGVTKTVQAAAIMADALGLGGAAVQKAIAVFAQKDTSVPMEDYKFKSEGIIETLEKLHRDFRAEKNEVDEAEVKSVAEYDALKQQKVDHVKAKTQELDDAKKEKSITIEEVAMNSEELTTVSAELLDNKGYAAELATMCESTAKTWDQRSKVRQDELSALTAAIAIIKNSVKESTSKATVRLAQEGVSIAMVRTVAQSDDAMEAVEAAAEEAESPSFLQKRSLRIVAQHQPTVQDGAVQTVAALLKKSGAQYKSTLLTSLAVEITADPLAKVKVLIQELIQRLLHEAAGEADQKGWCDKGMSDAKQKREYAADEVATLNGEMAELEAVRNKLIEELGVVVDEIAELKKNQKDATEMRKTEKVENAATVDEATAGLDAVNQAIDILDKFYKTAAKGSVDLSLLQGPADDAPSAGFEAGEAYTGAGGEAGGILGMLDVIKSDFMRTISATEKAEANAKEEYLNFMTKTGMSLAEKEMANEQKLKQKDGVMKKLSDAGDDLDNESKILSLAIKELIELKPICIDTGMSYEERVSRREDEVESLKKALCVLNAYAEYGPAGAGNAC